MFRKLLPHSHQHQRGCVLCVCGGGWQWRRGCQLANRFAPHSRVPSTHLVYFGRPGAFELSYFRCPNFSLCHASFYKSSSLHKVAFLPLASLHSTLGGRAKYLLLTRNLIKKNLFIWCAAHTPETICSVCSQSHPTVRAGALSTWCRSFGDGLR